MNRTIDTLALRPRCDSLDDRPGWRRWWQALVGGVARSRRPEAAEPSTWREPDLRSLRGLSTQTLRDIGAPDWVRAGRDDRARIAIEQLRL